MGQDEKRRVAEFLPELWDITVAEHELKGWLGPPMRFEHLEAAFQSKWLPARRLAVVQKSKHRAMDHFNENGVNACFWVG